MIITITKYSSTKNKNKVGKTYLSNFKVLQYLSFQPPFLKFATFLRIRIHHHFQTGISTPIPTEPNLNPPPIAKQPKLPIQGPIVK